MIISNNERMIKMNNLRKHAVFKDIDKSITTLIIEKAMIEYSLKTMEDEGEIASTGEIASKAADEIIKELGF